MVGGGDTGRQLGTPEDGGHAACKVGCFLASPRTAPGAASGWGRGLQSSEEKDAAARAVQPQRACPWFQERGGERAHAGGHRLILLQRLTALGARDRAAVLAVHRGQVSDWQLGGSPARG